MDVQERPLSRESWRDMTVEDGGGRSDRAWTAFPAPFQASAQSAAQAVQLGARALRSPKAALASLVVVLLLWLSASGRRQRQTFTTSSSGPSGPNIPTNASDPYPQLPVYALRDGTRFHRPVPPTDDPWPNNARIAREWLAADRFRRSSDSSSDQGQEEAAEYFTRPPREQYQVPAETIRRAFGVFGFSRRNWRSMRLNKGEAYNETDGRPLQIDRKDLYRGPSWWKPKKLGAAKSLPQVQKYRRDERDEEHRSMDQQRRDWVKRAFLHVWEGYKVHTWGHDELRPLSGSATDAFSGWGATIFDSLDTLLIMGLKDDYRLAREHIARVDFTYLGPKDPTKLGKPSASTLPKVASELGKSTKLSIMPPYLSSPQGLPTFETVIRYLGSMISAYDLSGDELMLERAIELADWLVPSMSTRSGLLVPTYRFGAHSNGGPSGPVVLAEVGSVSLEFTRLSQITGDDLYFQTISRAMDTLDNWRASERVDHLFPTQINPDLPNFLPGTYSFGGQGDSYYEYLIKMHQLLGGASEQYPRMYAAAIDAAEQRLIRPITVVPGLEGAVTFADLHFREQHSGQLKSWLAMRLDHLTTFAGGMLALGSRLLHRTQDLVTASKFTKACIWAYESTWTGLSPEIIQLWSEQDPRRWQVVVMEDESQTKSVKGDPMGVHSGQFHHIQRPETIETLLYMYRITGDRRYQDKGWIIFTSWVQATIVEKGFANLDDVNTQFPKHLDSGIESFLFGETLKYYYLLFSPPNLLSFDDWVFSTEAHPFRLRSSGRSKAGDRAPFWSSNELLKVPHYELGQGTHVQMWSRVVQAAAAVRQ